MSQSAALLDADLTAYFDDFGSPMTHEPSRPLQWITEAGVTLAMVLLAPLLVIPVALAFTVACIRMQRCDRDPTGHYRSAVERSVGERLSANRFGALASYRWN